MISLPPKGDTAKKLGAYFTPLRVSAQPVPNMSVFVTEGSFWTANNEHMEYFGGTSPTISAPASDAKWVLITVTSTGLLNVVDGIASGTPVLPPASSYTNELPLAALFIGDTTTAITDAMIFDARPLWSIPPDSVSQAQLNNFATITYVDNGLNLKADVTGTANADFTLNVGGSSINDSGIYIDRFSGPNVGIRFNETAMVGSPPVSTALWEFTNNGTDYFPLGASTGTFYSIAALDAGALDSLYYRETEFGGIPGAGVLDSRYFEQSVATSMFATIGHTHVVGDIFGLSNPVNTINSISPTAGDVQLGLDELNDVTISGTTIGAVIQYDGTLYRNTILSLSDLGDVALTSPAVNDALLWNGSTFLNRPLVKTDVADLDISATGDFLLITDGMGGGPLTGVAQDIYGVKTFKDGVNIETQLTITGANTSIQTTDLRVTDPYVDINFGEAGAGVGGGTGTAGIEIDRGTLPNAIIQWDESALQWELGVAGSVAAIITGVHTHMSIDVLDFATRVTTELGANDLTTIGDVLYLTAPVTGEFLLYGASNWENTSFTSEVLTVLNSNFIDQFNDVTYVGAPTTGDFLRYSGTTWENHVPVKADITDFVESDYIHVTGNEIKTGNLVINGDFTIGGSGTTTTFESSTVNVADDFITLNFGEAGGGVGGGTGTAGIEIDRGSEANAIFRWDDAAFTWAATNTAALTVMPLSFVGHNHIVADISDISITAGDINQLTGISSNVQIQLNDKISRTGDVMDASADLTFVSGGEVLGLPATPTAPDAATSMAYVDATFVDVAGDSMLAGANLTFISGGEVLGLPLTPSAPDAATSMAYVDTHITDMTVHLTGDQNTFLDALTLTGGTPLTAADVNQLIGITGNVQTQLDAKLDDVAGVAGNIATLDGTGELQDSAVPVASLATTASIYTQAQLDETAGLPVAGAKIDKVPGVVGNFVQFDALGAVIDNGLSLNDGGVLVTDLWSANQIDTAKVDKVPTAVVNNIGIFDAIGNLVDSGSAVADFALLAHTHLAADITDLAAALNTYITGTMVLNDVSNVSVGAPVLNDLIQFDGTSWSNISIVNAVGNEYVRRSGSVAETITGIKTFADTTAFQQNVTIAGDLTVVGTNTSLDVTNLLVTDQNVTLNSGYVGATSGSTGSGIHIDRNGITDPQAVIVWDDAIAGGRWTAGLDGTEEVVALENVTVAQPLYELVEPLAVVAVYSLTFGVPAPAAGSAGIQVFVNGIKQVEGATKAFTVDFSNPAQVVVTFNAGSEPAIGDDVEFYGFGTIG